MIGGHRKSPRERLEEAGQRCGHIPLWLPPWVYKRRLNAAMQEWNEANVALFDAQVAAILGAGYRQEWAPDGP